MSSINTTTAESIRAFLEKAYKDGQWLASMGNDYLQHEKQIDLIIYNDDLSKSIWADILRTNNTNKWATEKDLDVALKKGRVMGVRSFCLELWLNLYR
jgi:hypothetical protein